MPNYSDEPEHVSEPTAQYPRTHYDTSTEFDPGPPSAEELGADPLLPIPQLNVLILDGEYACAVISLAGDPEAPNMALKVQVRTILAMTVPDLQPQAVACLIADYGLSQEAAELLVENAKPELPRRGREAEHERARDEHERARDEHGRFVPEHTPAREA